MIALFVVLLMSISWVSLFIRYKQGEDDLIYRSWKRSAGMFIVFGFGLGCGLFYLFFKTGALILSPENVFLPEVLAVYSIKKWGLILFEFIILALLGISVYCAVLGYRFGDEHSDYEFSPWFLRRTSRADIMDEETKIRIFWTFVFLQIPNTILFYVIMLLFGIFPNFTQKAVSAVKNYFVPTAMFEMNERLTRAEYIEIDKTNIPIIYWKQLTPEDFSNHKDYSNQYRITVEYNHNKRIYTFDELGKLISVSDYDSRNESFLQKEIGNYAILDEYKHFSYPIHFVENCRMYYMAEPPRYTKRMPPYIELANTNNKGEEVRPEQPTTQVEERNVQINALVQNEVTIYKGDTLQLEFNKNTGKEINWLSSDKSICSVNNKGEIVAHNFGRCNIFASSISDNNIDTCQVNVIGSVVEAIRCDSVLTLGVRNKHKIHYFLYPRFAILGDVSVESDNNDIVEPLTFPYVRTNKLGSANLRITTTNGVSTSILVNVVEDRRKITKPINIDIDKITKTNDCYYVNLKYTYNEDLGVKYHSFDEITISKEGKILFHDNNRFDYAVMYRDEFNGDIEKTFNGAECIVECSNGYKIIDTLYVPF